MKTVAVLLILLFSASAVSAQDATGAAPGDAIARAQEIGELRSELARISARLDALEDNTAAAAPTASAKAAQPATAVATAIQPAQPVAAASPVTTPVQSQQPAAPSLYAAIPSVLPGGATLNYTFDGYYEYNFNQPPGRVNDLRAYDVLSNTFSINQADVIFALDPDLGKGRRYGVRLDLQFGQATETLQGNPSNEPRPDIYRNIFQAYGTYVMPVGKGINIDFGKWASSLGTEGNYTKDQSNYTRSYYFYYLPFYHAGARASYHFNDKFAVNYWIVNGANQSEPTNGFKDGLFGFVLTPTKKITWTSNYYLGQEHPDSTAATNCTGPVQPGLCVTPITPAPNGKLHIFDNYITWQARPKLTLTAEGDYVIEREWANAAPGESSAPLPCEWWRGLCAVPVQCQGRACSPGGISLRPWRLVQRNHAGAERSYRHLQIHPRRWPGYFFGVPP